MSTMGNAKSTKTQSQANPSESPRDASNIKKKVNQVTIDFAGEKIKVHTVDMISTETNVEDVLTVLFLHGGSFSSQTWIDIKTMEQVAKWGHRAFAIDLPGFGETRERLPRQQPAKFLNEVILQLDLRRIVLVSPSMSGSYALPYLFSGSETSVERVIGFVPIAPADVRSFRDKYSECQLPTLIVYGTNDESGVYSLEYLKLLPKHEVGAIKEARHACYMNNTEAFHKLLHDFLKKSCQ